MKWSDIINEADALFDESRISVKEVHDTKWNIVRYTFTIPLAHRAEIEAYVEADGDTLKFKDITTSKGDHPLAFDNGSLSAHYGHGIRLGTAETRRLIQFIFTYVRTRHPEIKSIASTRVTGARHRSGKRDMALPLPDDLSEHAASIPETITATSLDGRKVTILQNPSPAVLVQRVKQTRGLRGVVVGTDCFWANSATLIHVQIGRAVGADEGIGDARLELRWRDGTARLTVLRAEHRTYDQIVAVPQVQRLVAYLAQLFPSEEMSH